MATCGSVLLMAQKISVVREELAQLRESYGEMTVDLARMIEMTRAHHEDDHREVFRYCKYELCQLAGELEQAWSEVLS